MLIEAREGLNDPEMKLQPSNTYSIKVNSDTAVPKVLKLFVRKDVPR